MNDKTISVAFWEETGRVAGGGYGRITMLQLKLPVAPRFRRVDQAGRFAGGQIVRNAVRIVRVAADLFNV